MVNIIWTIVAVLFIIWLAGFLLSFGGAFIHIALVVALILVAYNLLTKGRASI